MSIDRCESEGMRGEHAEHPPVIEGTDEQATIMTSIMAALSLGQQEASGRGCRLHRF
jgi:hypothetical protein